VTDDAASPEDGEAYEDEAEVAVAPGLGVTALAGATAAVAGFAAGGPFGAAIGAAATPFLAVVFQKTADKIWSDRSRRADDMLEAAAGAAGLTPEQLADRAGESEQTRFLTDKAVQAAADTIWPAGVRAIGRAYAAGLLATDKPALDIRLRALGIMQDLDEMHVSLLELLVKYEPKWQWDGAEYVADPYLPASYADSDLVVESPDNPRRWIAGRRMWRTDTICQVMPEIEQVLPSLLGELRESGLARENDTAPEGIRHLDEKLREQVNVHAFKVTVNRTVEPLRLDETSRALLEPTWSPTELGEKILAFYAEAGAGRPWPELTT
jgi:hypothetical protein